MGSMRIFDILFDEGQGKLGLFISTIQRFFGYVFRGEDVLAPPFWRRAVLAPRVGAGRFGAEGWRWTFWRRGRSDFASDESAAR